MEKKDGSFTVGVRRQVNNRGVKARGRSGKVLAAGVTKPATIAARLAARASRSDA